MQFHRDHKERLGADFKEFELTLSMALRQNLLTSEEHPLPIKLGSEWDMREQRKLPDILKVEFDVVKL
jgi:hypothetical protein